MKRTLSLTLALLLTLGITSGVYYDANATAYNDDTEGTNICTEERTGFEEPEIIYEDISEEEYEAIIARENAEADMTSEEKLTDGYWSKFSGPYYNYVDKFSDRQKELYDKIYASLYGMIDGGADCSVGTQGTYVTPAISCGLFTDDEIRNIGRLMLYDHPELYFLKGGIVISTTTSSLGLVTKAIKFEVYEDFATGVERITAAKTLRERVDWYLSQVNATSAYEKEKQIHDLMCQNVAYKLNGPHAQTAYSSLVEGESVCAGYSEGFAMLCYAVGIPTISVSSSEHEWNEVKLGNTWYAVDVTWDDDYDIHYNYFDKSDKTIQSYSDTAKRMHTVEAVPWLAVGRPECPKDYTGGDDYMNVYRLYNPNSGEHFYTTDYNERVELAKAGWNYEGISWKAPYADASNTPVYRLYSPAGDHHYTISLEEKEWLEEIGWSYEGINWYSDDDKGMPLYRLNNPNTSVGAHHYTADATERDGLVDGGWEYEGIGWYGKS